MPWWWIVGLLVGLGTWFFAVWVMCEVAGKHDPVSLSSRIQTIAVCGALAFFVCVLVAIAVAMQCRQLHLLFVGK